MPRLSVFFLRAALVHLAVGITFGALMLANKGIPFAPVLWRLLETHVELVIVGWTMQLVAGVAGWILPRLPGPEKYGHERFGWAAFWLLNGGIVMAAVAQALGADATGWSAGGRLLQTIAFILFAAQVWPRIRPLALQPRPTSD